MNLFQQIAQLGKQQEVSSLESERLRLNAIPKYFRELDWQEDYTKWFAELRKLKYETILKAQGFMCAEEEIEVHNLPEEFHDDRLGFVYSMRMVYSGRFVFPVMDVRGNVMGFVGYNKTFEEDGGPKYLDSRSIGYQAKRTTFYGMEELGAYYESDHIYITEGCICALFLREQGMNAVSVLGSSLAPYVSEVFNRFGRRAIFIVDNDEKGTKFARQVKRDCPKARVIHMANGKDVDDVRDTDNAAIVELQEYTTKPFGRYTAFRTL
jgi:hypothetical protein